jgi:hypothetical protein
MQLLQIVTMTDKQNQESIPLLERCGMHLEQAPHAVRGGGCMHTLPHQRPRLTSVAGGRRPWHRAVMPPPTPRLGTRRCTDKRGTDV